MAERGATGRPVNRGPGRVLLVVYVVFAISAGARAIYQIAVQFERAPLAYLLSALAALIYLVAAVAIGRGTPAATRVARGAVVVELVGVVGVGLLSVLVPSDFPDATVWSDFGIGYGFIPVVLPILGLLWLRGARTAPGSGDQGDRARVE